MIPIKANFPNKNQTKGEKCKNCGETENMKHIYTCNENQENNLEYENIFGENLRKIKKVFQKFKTKYENIENQKNIFKSPCDPLCDPLFSLSECSNGNLT